MKVWIVFEEREGNYESASVPIKVFDSSEIAHAFITRLENMNPTLPSYTWNLSEFEVESSLGE